jgi:hypothetical protein
VRKGVATVEDDDNTIYSVDEVPDVVSREWWLKYKHNFYWEGNRLMLKKRDY